MERLGRSCMCVMPLVALLLATGCADPKQKKIDELTSELNQVKGDLAARQQENQKLQDAIARHQQDLQSAQADRDQALQSMSALQDQLQRAQAEGAKAKPAMRNGWVVTPGAAMISIESDLLFASGKADITAGGEKKLADVAREIRKEYSNRDIWVIGFTDTDPIRKTHWKDNWDLSAERSLTVLRVLLHGGVRPEHLVQAGRGQYHPVSGVKAKNRRVEIYAVEASPSRHVSNSSSVHHVAAKRSSGSKSKAAARPAAKKSREPVSPE